MFPSCSAEPRHKCFISTSPETPTCRSSSAVFPSAGPPRGMLEGRNAASGDGAKRSSSPLRLGCGAAARWDARLCGAPGPTAPHRDFGAAGGKKRLLESVVRRFVFFRALPAAAEEEVALRCLLLPGRGSQQHAGGGHRRSHSLRKALFCSSISKPDSRP